MVKTCERIGGFEPYGVYSEADKDSLHVQRCKGAINIGGFLPSESYLRIDRIIEAAQKLGCDMIHPGYGFLAENSSFSASCAASGLDFVGPAASTLELTGDKAKAREVGSSIAPVLPGKEVAGEDEAVALAQEIGYPVIIKAVRGGGGRGLRVANSDIELRREFIESQKESQLSFGSSRLYIEKYLQNPRHIEVQVISDGDKAVHLGERECSIQRRHQKLIEETPSVALTQESRNRLTETAIAVMNEVSYKNAGTVEFLYDNGKFYFMEVNSRIQVEHPITEQVTGIDIVEHQLLIGSGQGLGLTQTSIPFSGHAIECRINAEHPLSFAPYPGVVTKFIPPSGGGIRTDTFMYAGYSIPPFYDSLIAKLICHASDRLGAIEKMKQSLNAFRIAGIPTTVPFHLSALNDQRFVNGKYDTAFVDGLIPYSLPDVAAAAAVISLLPRRIHFTKEESGVDPWLQSSRNAIVNRQFSRPWKGYK